MEKRALPSNCYGEFYGNLVCENDSGTFDLYARGVGWWAFGLDMFQAEKHAHMYPAPGYEKEINQ